MVAAGEMFSFLDHPSREVDSIHVVDPWGHTSSDVASATTHVQNDAWHIENKRCERLEDLFRIRRAVMIGCDDARVSEPGTVLATKMARLWQHLAPSLLIVPALEEL